MYERRQEKHTCAYFPSAFLREKTPGLDQRERSEFPREQTSQVLLCGWWV